MSRKFRIRDQEAVYFVTFTVVNWLDVFIRVEYRDFFMDSVRYCQQHKGLEVYAYCVMSSHVHMIVARHGEQNLEDVIRDMKKFTSSRIIEAINNNSQESRREYLLWFFDKAGASNSNNKHYQFWQQHSHPIELNTNEKLDQRVNYIHNNPVEAGLVRYREEYLYSSAGNYARLRDNVLEIMLS